MALDRLLQPLASRYWRLVANSDELASPTSLKNTRPRLAHVLASKRIRLTAFSALLSCLVLAAFYGHFFNLLRVREAAVSSKGELLAVATHQSSSGVDVDWDRLAYTQYATDSIYLCNSVMLFDRIHRLGSRAARVLMYPEGMLDVPAAESDDARLLLKARDEYGAELVPFAVQHRPTNDPTWGDSFTKLLAFNQTRFDRVLSIDSDTTVLRNLDELFFLPPTPVAMPRAYWLYPDKPMLSSHLMVAQPSAAEFARIQSRIYSAGPDEYDMEIMNELYGTNALVLPHRPYALLTAEFREDEHSKYLGSEAREWDPVAVFNETKLIHFSDWPVPKPWLMMADAVNWKVHAPRCVQKGEVEDCRARDLWTGLYTDFRERRARVCEFE